MRVRASIGTLGAVGLQDVSMLARPTTAYFLQHSEGGCLARCAYCTQSSSNPASKERLSRVPWPACDLESVAPLVREAGFERACLQTVVKPGFLREALEFARVLRETGVSAPISVALTPVPRSQLEELRRAGVERIGVGLDAACPAAFAAVEKPYSWGTYVRFVRDAVRVFGTATVHLIVGLGEGLLDLLQTMGELTSLGADIALFPFTPVRGVRFRGRRPPVEEYRVVQAIRYLLASGREAGELARVEGGRLVIADDVLDVPLEAFLTSGCPGCNRPFYTESPTRIYNYPSIDLLRRDSEVVREQLERGVRLLGG